MSISRTCSTAALVCLLLCAARTTSAQPNRLPARVIAPERIRVVIDAGAGIPLSSFAQSFALRRNAEDMPVTDDVKLPFAARVDGGVRIRASRTDSVGVIAFYGQGNAKGHVTAMVPHPFFFNQRREVRGDASGLQRREMGVHLEFVHTFAVRSRTDLSIFGGPSFIVAQQDLVSDVTYAEAYPYDAATFVSATTTSARKTGFGLNVGGDVIWHVGTKTGIGFQMRYVHGSVDLPDAGKTTVALQPGGLEAGIGLRVLIGRRSPARVPPPRTVAPPARRRR